MKILKYLTVGIVGLFFGGLVAVAQLKPDTAFSKSERRVLAQFPELSVKNVLSGKFMKEFDDYAMDQFPMRDMFRRIKALYFRNIMQKPDNNGIYIEKGYAAKLDYPLDTASVRYAINRFRYISDKYLEKLPYRTYISVIPDKGYFLAEDNGYPAMDYGELFKIVKEEASFATYIDIVPFLSLNLYYKTDTHWRQDKIEAVADVIAENMGVTRNAHYEEKKLEGPFYGVYHGMSALPLKGEELVYLTNPILEECIVTNFENGKVTKVYDMEKAYGRDPYEMFLSGPVSLITIDNPQANNDRKLVIFRDSFGSSLAPLLVEAYSKITLVDIRYISPDLLGRFVDFYDADVLFLYSTLILNSSRALQ